MQSEFSALKYWDQLEVTGMKQLTRTRTAAALFAAALLASAVNAEAGAIANIELVKWGPHASSGPNVTLHNSSGTAISTDALTYGGAFLWNGLPGSSLSPAPTIDDFVDPTPLDTGTDLITFCLELNENIAWGGKYHAEILPLDQLPSSGAPPGSNPGGMGTLSAELIAKLWAKYYPTAIEPKIPQSPIGWDAAGAFQLAIWKLEYDPELMTGNSFDKSQFGTGFLTVSAGDVLNNSIVAMAATWISDILLNKSNPLYQMANLRGLRLVDYNGGAAQDQIVQLTGGNIQSVPAPEPASLAIWLVVGAALAFPKLRRCRTESTTDSNA